MSPRLKRPTSSKKNSYLTAVKGVQDYNNNKFFEFAHENINAAFDFIQNMSGVRLTCTMSPSQKSPGMNERSAGCPLGVLVV